MAQLVGIVFDTPSMKKHSLLTLSCLLSISTGTAGFWLLPTASPFAAQASTNLGKSVTALDATTLAMANRGEWPAVIDRLQKLTADATAVNTNHAWLAFAMMFQDRCDALNSLAQTADRLNTASHQDGQYATIVKLFDCICRKQYDDARKLAATIKADTVIGDMALAALAVKTEHTAEAIDYLRKALALAPDFAWGHRTIGLIQERSLKDLAAAEASYVQALSIAPDSREMRDRLVDCHIARHDFDGAVAIAKDGIKSSAHDPLNYYRLSQIYTQQWRLQEADEQLDKAIRLAPDTAKFHRAKASILRFQHKLDQAIAEQKRAVALSSDKPFELTELAALYELAGNDSAAADTLKQALAVAPVSQASYNAAHQKLVQLLTRGQRWDDLISEYKRGLQAQPQDALLHLGLADALIKSNRVDEGLDELKKAADLDNNDPRPHRMTGAILFAKRDFAAASRAYTRALNINPGSVEDLVALGFTYAADDEYMKAETAFITALALQQLTQSPASRQDVMRSLATLLLSEGRYTEATVNYEEIVRTLKDSPGAQQDAFMLAETKALRDRTTSALQDALKAYAALPEEGRQMQRAGLIDTMLRLGRADGALAELAKAPAADKQQCQWLILQSRAQRLKGDLKAAQEFAAKATATKDDSKELQSAAYSELALALLSNGDLNGADTAVRKATDLNPKSFHAYEVEARIYLKRGDAAHAIEAAKQSVDINPYHTPAYLLMGDAYLSQDKLDDAVTNYKRAVELYPGNLDAHRSLRDAYKKLANKDGLKQEEQVITEMEKKG